MLLVTLTLINNSTDILVIKDDYDGKPLGDNMTLEFINDMISRFSNGKKIHLKYVYQVSFYKYTHILNISDNNCSQKNP